MCTLTGHTAPVLSIAFSPDGTRIVTGSGNDSKERWEASEIKIWDVTTGSEVIRVVGTI